MEAVCSNTLLASQKHHIPGMQRCIVCVIIFNSFVIINFLYDQVKELEREKKQDTGFAILQVNNRNFHKGNPYL